MLEKTPRGKTPLARVVIVTAIVTAGALGIALVIGFAAGGFRPWELGRAGTAVDERASIPLDGINAVAIAGTSGTVRILEGSGSAVEAWLHGSMSPGSPDAIPHIQAVRNGSRVEIGVRQASPVTFGFFWSNLTLELSVPRGYKGQVSAQASSGDIEVADHDFAGLQLVTSSGSIRAGLVTATELTMHTTSGDLSVQGVKAPVSELSSTSGRIGVAALTGDVRAQSSSGDVMIAFTAAPSRVEAGASSGSITLRLPADAGFVLDARSSSGDVSCGFPITLTGSGSAGARHVMQGTIGSGSGRISVHTSSGDIRIER
jgi:lia operon protein LiaG